MNTVDYDEIIPDIRYFICRYCTPNWLIQATVIDFVDLTYVVNGKATYTVNNIPYVAEKGDLICIPNKSLRYAESDPDNPMEAFASNLYLYNLKGMNVSLPFPIHSTIGIHYDLLALYHELNFEWMRKKPGFTMKVRAIFLNILHRYFSLLYKDTNENIDHRVEMLVRHIHKNYYHSLNINTLAGIVNLNPSYVGTLVKKHTGATVTEHINKIRINNAENMLVSGEFTVAETAHKCGFEDPFYFSKVFKKVKGYSPSKVLLKK